MKMRSKAIEEHKKEEEDASEMTVKRGVNEKGKVNIGEVELCVFVVMGCSFG